MKGDPGSLSDSQAASSFDVQLEHLMTTDQDEKSSDTTVDNSKLHLIANGTLPDTPHHNGAEPVTIHQLIELVEAAVEAKGRSSVDQTDPADCKREEHGNLTSMLSHLT